VLLLNIILSTKRVWFDHIRYVLCTIDWRGLHMRMFLFYKITIDSGLSNTTGGCVATKKACGKKACYNRRCVIAAGMLQQ
jgi:hypothetical protein